MTWTGDPFPVLLVQLPIPPPGPQPIRGNVPLAAAFLKVFARRNGMAHRAIDILPARSCNELGDQALAAAILERRPRLVGFTCYLWNVQRTLWIAGLLKAARPQLQILLGGPEITADNLWVLEHPAVDLAVIGEGEQTFVELLAALDAGGSFDNIAGLWRRGGPPPCRRNSLAELDAVGSPYVEGILDAADERTMLMETSRGCRYRCKFCYYPKSYDTVHRRSAARIEDELRYANRQGVEEIYLLDPTLNQRPDFAGFLDLLARGNPDCRFTYSAELRAEGIRPETARLLSRANFREVEVGLQSVDPTAQELMGRRVRLEAFERGARAMLDEGIRVRADLILGLPGDTVDSIRRGLEYLHRVRPLSELQVFNLSILPGTAFRDSAGALGLEFQPRPPYYVLRTPTLDLEDLYDLMAEAQDAFGVEFDSMPEEEELSAELEQVRKADAEPPSPIRRCVVCDLDRGPAVLPAAECRSLAFTLWLRSADFGARADEVLAVVSRLLADNPHSTLQVVLEPTGEPRRLAPGLLESLLRVCHEGLSYLDWYSSLHPAGLRGAKRLVVMLPRVLEGSLPAAWLAEIRQRAAVAREPQQSRQVLTRRGRIW